MAVTVDGTLPPGVAAKDIILAIINRIGTGGGVGHVIEYRGSAIRALSMEGRMTSATCRSRAVRAPAWWRPTTRRSPTSRADRTRRPGPAWEQALEDWRALPTDEGATFDKEVTLDASTLRPYVSWGTNPAQSVTIDEVVPDPDAFDDPGRSARPPRARSPTWTSRPARRSARSGPNTIFIGSCTNSRMEDLRVAAGVVAGRKVADGLRALVVPGSFAVKQEAEAEGLDKVFDGRGVRVARRRVLDVPGHEPRHPEPGRAQRLDLQPELRGTTGQGRTHAPGQPGRGRRHRDRRTLHDPRGPLIDGTDRDHRGHGAAGRPQSTSTPTRSSRREYLKRVERTGFGPFLFDEWRKDPDFVMNDPRYAGASILLAGAELRMRVEPRARARGRSRTPASGP